MGGEVANNGGSYDLVYEWIATFKLNGTRFRKSMKDELSRFNFKFVFGDNAVYQLKPTMDRLVSNVIGGESHAQVEVRWELEGHNGS